MKCINCFKELKTKAELEKMYCRDCQGDSYSEGTSNCCDAVIVNGRCYRCKELVL